MKKLAIVAELTTALKTGYVKLAPILSPRICLESSFKTLYCIYRVEILVQAVGISMLILDLCIKGN